MKKNYSMNEIFVLLSVGLIAGMVGGLVGIGGGLIIVPVLVYLVGYSQHMAQGTALFMMMLPVGILGVINYWKAGMIEWKTALIIASTFVIGSFLGSKLALSLDKQSVQRIFGVVMLLVSVKLILGK